MVCTSFGAIVVQVGPEAVADSVVPELEDSDLAVSRAADATKDSDGVVLRIALVWMAAEETRIAPLLTATMGASANDADV